MVKFTTGSRAYICVSKFKTQAALTQSRPEVSELLRRSARDEGTFISVKTRTPVGSKIGGCDPPPPHTHGQFQINNWDTYFELTRPDVESENQQNHIFSKTSGMLLCFGGKIE